ncbi:MAG: hypothetical protein LCH61_05280 [Proteobacteria bacterium]|nr:hypothetical protein [Pseudomonadota bacterium]
MTRFFLIPLFVAGLALPALAQQRTTPKPPAGRETPQPTTLNTLFERLAKAKDSAEGRAIARQIEQRWMRSGSDSANLLMSRVTQVSSGNDNATALELLDHIIMLQPQWAEAYSRRATILFMMDDYDGALRDLRLTLAREPRHYGALAGLGLMMQKIGNTKAAYAAYSKALEIHPQLDDVRAVVERMKPETIGQDI